MIVVHTFQAESPDIAGAWLANALNAVRGEIIGDPITATVAGTGRPGHYLATLVVDIAWFGANDLRELLLLLDDDACAFLASQKVGVYVSLHRPEKAGPALNAARRHGVLVDVNASAAISSFDWAGQVDWEVTAPNAPCEWLRAGWCNVLVDGRITRCCLDAAGAGVMGHVDDEPGAIHTSPFSLCNGCHMTITEPLQIGGVQ